MTSRPENRLTRWLAGASTPVFMGYAASSAFATYFCMYGFRKSFAAGSYTADFQLGPFGHVDTKIVLIVAQIIGYCLSKFLGIKLVSEMTAAGRKAALIAAIALAEAALVLFAILPPKLAPLCMFLNGLPLGLTWGLVFGFLEGRRSSDGLGAAVCASFIIASGFAKTVGKLLLTAGVSEAWMPAAAGALFFLPTMLSVGLLAQLPPPTLDDELQRTKREPMDADARRRFALSVAPGLIALVFAYVLLTAYRDFRDNFARELWDALGYVDAASVLTTAELPVAIGALLAVGLVMWVKDNARALLLIHALMVTGALTIGVSTLLYRLGVLGAGAWMVTLGVGLYVGYVPFNCVLFDRLVAALGTRANAGFLIYIADAFGYLGSVALLVYKMFGAPRLSWLAFFESVSLVTAVVSSIAFAFSGLYFAKRVRVPDGR